MTFRPRRCCRRCCRCQQRRRNEIRRDDVGYGSDGGGCGCGGYWGIAAVPDDGNGPASGGDYDAMPPWPSSPPDYHCHRHLHRPSHPRNPPSAGIGKGNDINMQNFSKF